MSDTPAWIEYAAQALEQECWRGFSDSNPEARINLFARHLRAAVKRAVSAAPQSPASAGDVEAVLTAIAQALPITLDDCALRPAATAALAAAHVPEMRALLMRTLIGWEDGLPLHVVINEIAAFLGMTADEARAQLEEKP